jgi:beta-lactam-binding protein with PASTA domain
VKEAARVLPIHANPELAYVPEIRGKGLEKAREMQATVGLELGATEEVIGSVWAPDRIMAVQPEVGTELKKGEKVAVSVTGDWLCGPQTVDTKSAW